MNLESNPQRESSESKKTRPDLYTQDEEIFKTAALLYDLKDSEKARRLRDRYLKSLKRCAERIGQVTMVLILASILNQARVRNEIKEIEQHGEITYRHPDSETTEIIEQISGKTQPFTEKEKLIQMNKAVKDLARDNYVSLPFRVGPITEDVLKSQVRYILERSGQRPMYYRTSLNEVVDGVFEVLKPTEYEFNAELYKRLWLMESRYGAPKIRWKNQSMLFFIKGADGVYNPLNNTIYIDRKPRQFQIDNFIAELAHAKQFDENPTFSYARFVAGLIRSTARVVSGVDPDEAFKREYKKEGTLEHEAHSVIEPELKRDLPHLRPKERILNVNELTDVNYEY